MRIGIDARPLAGPPAGIRTYLSELLKAVAGLASNHDFLLYSHRPVAFDAPNGQFHVRIHRAPRGLGPFWLQLYGPRLAHEDGVDLFWGAHFLLPLRLPQRIPATVTIYDLVPFLFPETMQPTKYLVTRLFLPPSLARAQRVMVISESVAADVQHVFHLPSDRIDVVPPGVRAGFLPRDPLEARRRVAERFGLDPQRPYLLTVGTVEPRKNLLTLVNALTRVPPSLRARCTLAVAGAPGWKTSALRHAAAPLVREGTIRFLGFVSHDDLPWLYAGAALFLFPSLYEGFGIPLVEAMASGIPVVASDIPIVREVAADAGLHVTPTDADAWAKAMTEILDDSARQARMRERGLVRAARYTFERSARHLLEIFETLAPRRQL